MNVFVLKMIAIISMTIDHFGYILYDNNTVMRAIGRIAFPIFCFLITEGYIHTRSLKRYMIRLGSFAIISEIPFNLAFTGKPIAFTHQNVFITLFLGVLSIYAMDHFKNQIYGIGVFLAICGVAMFSKCDYGAGGIMIIMVMHLFKKDLKKCIIITAIVMLLMYKPLELFGLLAFIPILLYNGKVGFRGLKYFFYAYYPLHLILIRLQYVYMHTGKIYLWSGSWIRSNT